VLGAKCKPNTGGPSHGGSRTESRTSSRRQPYRDFGAPGEYGSRDMQDRHPFTSSSRERHRENTHYPNPRPQEPMEYFDLRWGSQHRTDYGYQEPSEYLDRSRRSPRSDQSFTQSEAPFDRPWTFNDHTTHEHEEPRESIHPSWSDWFIAVAAHAHEEPVNVFEFFNSHHSYVPPQSPERPRAQHHSRSAQGRASQNESSHTAHRWYH
jgi:hypothetical protein